MWLLVGGGGGVESLSHCSNCTPVPPYHPLVCGRWEGRGMYDAPP